MEKRNSKEQSLGSSKTTEQAYDNLEAEVRVLEEKVAKLEESLDHLYDLISAD